MSTNMAAPLTSWTPLLTNLFDGDGNFNSPTPAASQRAAKFLPHPELP